MNTSADDLALPSGTQWHLRAAGYTATIVEVGGGLRTLRHDGVDLVAGYDEDAMADAARGQVLAPWPNRIAGGRYAFDGAEYELPLTEPKLANASHGLARWLPWRAVEHATNRLTLACTIHPQPGWSWVLRLEMTYALGQDGLTVTPRATNLSSEPCPFGFGMHPYLTSGEETLDDATLTAPVGMSLDVDDHLVPIGHTALDDHTARAYAAARGLRGLGLDTCFTDLTADDDGRWRISLAAGDRRTTLWADAAAYRYAQVFTGDSLPEPQRRRSGLAVEPMTCPANAFNTGEGLMVLQPGESWSASFGIRDDSPDPDETNSQDA